MSVRFEWPMGSIHADTPAELAAVLTAMGVSLTGTTVRHVGPPQAQTPSTTTGAQVGDYEWEHRWSQEPRLSQGAALHVLQASTEPFRFEQPATTAGITDDRADADRCVDLSNRRQILDVWG